MPKFRIVAKSAGIVDEIVECDRIKFSDSTNSVRFFVGGSITDGVLVLSLSHYDSVRRIWPTQET